MYTQQHLFQNPVALPLSMIKVPIEKIIDPEYEPPALGPEGEVEVEEPLEPVENEPSPKPEEGEGSVPPSPITP